MEVRVLPKSTKGLRFRTKPRREFFSPVWLLLHRISVVLLVGIAANQELGGEWNIDENDLLQFNLSAFDVSSISTVSVHPPTSFISIKSKDLDTTGIDNKVKIYSATISGTSSFLTELSKSPYVGSIKIVGNTTLSVPLKIYHNQSIGLSQKQRNYSVFGGSMVRLGFGPEDVVGKFTKVSQKDFGLVDNRLQIKSLSFNSSGIWTADLPNPPLGKKFVKAFNMGAFGFFGLWYQNQGTKFNTTLVFIQCFNNHTQKMVCKEISRAKSVKRKETIDSVNLLGSDLVLLQLMGEGGSEEDPKTEKYFRVHNITSGKTLGQDFTPSKSVFNLNHTFNSSIQVQTRTSLTSYNLNISFVLNRQTSTLYKSQAVFIRATYSPENNSMSRTAPTITKSFNTTTEIQSFDIEEIRDGKLLKVIKYKSVDPADKYGFRIYMDTADGGSKVVNSTSASYGGGDSNMRYYQTLDNKVYYIPFSKSRGYFLNYLPNKLKKWDRFTGTYGLSFEKSSMNIQKVVCYSTVNFVQVLFEDSPENGSKKYLVNFQLGTSTDYRTRYHSKIEVDQRTVDIKGSLSEDGSLIQTVLSKAGMSGVKDVQIVLTRTNQYSLSFNSSRLTKQETRLDVQIADWYGQKDLTKVDIQIIQPVKENLTLNLPAANKSKEVNVSTLLRINELIDLDKYFDLKGSVANIGIEASLKEFKPGVDYEFRSRKYEIGHSSVEEHLPETQGGFQSISSESLDQMLLFSNETQGRIEKSPKSTLSVINNLKMQNMVVIGNWMITQMKLGSDNPYLNLAYRPQDFEKRDKTKDQKLLSKKVGSIDTKIESFRAQEDPFSSTKDNTEILLAVKKQIMDLNENKATYLLEVYRSTGPTKNSQKDPLFPHLSQIELPSYTSQLDYRVFSISPTRICIIYRTESFFTLLLYTLKDTKNPSDNTTDLKSEDLNKYKLSVQHKQKITKIPDYWTARLETYKNRNGKTSQGVMLLAGYYSSSLLVQYWWSADETNTFKVSIPFALFTDIVVNTHMINCEPLRDYDFTASNVDNNNLGPYLVKIKCLIGADGAFNYITEYTFDISKDNNMPLTLSRLDGKIVSPDSFRTEKIQTLPGAIVSKLANKNPYVEIDPLNPSKFPYMIAVYRLAISKYPWAVYSCSDFNMNAPGYAPLFSAYSYSSKNYLWINRKLRGSKATDGQISLVTLSKVIMVKGHTIKNTTIKFMKFLNFNDIKVTLKDLNGNIILKNLGLLGSSFMTPFELTFSFNPLIWGMMFVFTCFVIYCGIFKDLLSWKIYKILFGGYINEDQEMVETKGQSEPNTGVMSSTGSPEIILLGEQEQNEKENNQSLINRSTDQEEQIGDLNVWEEEDDDNDESGSSEESKDDGAEYNLDKGSADGSSSDYAPSCQSSGDWVIGQKYQFDDE